MSNGGLAEVMIMIYIYISIYSCHLRRARFWLGVIYHYHLKLKSTQGQGKPMLLIILYRKQILNTVLKLCEDVTLTLHVLTYLEKGWTLPCNHGSIHGFCNKVGQRTVARSLRRRISTRES